MNLVTHAAIHDMPLWPRSNCGDSHLDINLCITSVPCLSMVMLSTLRIQSSDSFGLRSEESHNVFHGIKVICKISREPSDYYGAIILPLLARQLHVLR